MHPKDIQLNLCLLVCRIEFGHRSESRRSGVGTQDRDVATGQLLGQLRPLARVGEIDRPYLDDYPVLLRDAVGQCPQHVLAPGRDDQVMPSRGELDGQRLADVLRSTCDNCAGIRAGCGYWHAPDYIVGDDGRSATASANRHAVAGPGVGAVGRRRDGCERRRRHLRLSVRRVGIAPGRTALRPRPRAREGRPRLGRRRWRGRGRRPPASSSPCWLR